jgi:hypothetical protein
MRTRHWTQKSGGTLKRGKAAGPKAVSFSMPDSDSEWAGGRWLDLSRRTGTGPGAGAAEAAKHSLLHPQW